MKVTLIVVGKSDLGAISTLIAEYKNRLKHYCRFELLVAKSVTKAKGLTVKEILEHESREIQKHLNPKAVLVLLDDKGAQKSSLEFSAFLGDMRERAVPELCFLIGGAYGFSEHIRSICLHKLSLSKMTFTHQMVRPIFMEQLYRAFTILNSEPYHHE
ncbi:MAG: 23S rRNA (pseudouridine(1915)-N(3))-methyltransferase RlmH [Flavobacteriaceae bacterium]